MKKFMFLLATALMTLAQSANAQEATDKNLFNHLSVGVGVGILDGINFEVAVPVTDYLALRAGYSFLPSISVKTDISIDTTDPSIINDEVEVEGKLNKKDVKLLLDVYPFKKFSFRVTAGAYIGAGDLLSVHNTEQFVRQSDWETAGVNLVGRRFATDDKGNVEARIQVNKFKPYLGIGFGRAVPKKRLAFNFDLGVQFWGKPGIYTDNLYDIPEGRHAGQLKLADFDSNDDDYEDIKDVFDIMDKVTICPVLSFRLNGRIF